MAGVADDDNVAFAVLLYSYIIAREEEDEQQTDQLQPQPQRARRAAVRQFWVRPWLREERRNLWARELVADRDAIPAANQSLINYIGSYLNVRAGVLDNFVKDPENFTAMQLRLHNKGQVTITKATWKIYFNCLYGAKVEDIDCGLTVGHVNGDLYYFTPTPSFPGIGPGEELVCTWHQKWWNVAISDFFPNWFVSAEGTVARLIVSTNETFSFILPYNTERKWKRSRDDLYNPYTTQERYDMHKLVDYGKRTAIIPTPLYIEMSKNYLDDSLSSSNGWVIVNGGPFAKEARYLADVVSLSVVATTPLRKYIQFRKLSIPDIHREEYNLNITGNRILVSARDSPGAFYGVQTIISLWNSTDGQIPVMFIKDKPRFEYRGLMIDIARSFKPKEWIFELLDAMAMYKLNKLHLHLSDDGAWRLEIPEIPELTEMGSNRCHNHETNICLLPQRGSGPYNTTSGTGYYTVQDYKDILRYAANRHIAVIPEFDMPGHSRAAVASMRYRDSKLQQLRNQGHDTSNMKSYVLNDVMINRNVSSTQHWKGNAMNPCLNSTYEFVDKVLEELINIHSSIMELKTFHMGGDEVTEGAWDGSPACEMIPGHISTVSLKRYFIGRVADIVARKGLDVAAWEDGVYADDKPNNVTDFRSRNVYTYIWFNTWEKGRANRSAQFADAGYKVVLSVATHLYLDHSHEPDPEEMGLYWATRYTNTEKIFGFIPDDIFANADVTTMGRPIDLGELCGDNWCPKTKKPENIIGVQGSMFSDQIRNKEQMHHALFPRMIAVAERAWHKADWEDIDDRMGRDKARKLDWEQFANVLGYQELPRLERKAIKYRVPPPGAQMDGNVLRVNTLFPNHDVEMSNDGGNLWTIVSDNDHALPPGTHKLHLRTISPITRRASRVVVMETHVSSSSVVTVKLYALFGLTYVLVRYMLIIADFFNYI